MHEKCFTCWGPLTSRSTCLLGVSNWNVLDAREAQLFKVGKSVPLLEARVHDAQINSKDLVNEKRSKKKTMVIAVVAITRSLPHKPALVLASSLSLERVTPAHVLTGSSVSQFSSEAGLDRSWYKKIEMKNMKRSCTVHGRKEMETHQARSRPGLRRQLIRCIKVV